MYRERLGFWVGGFFPSILIEVMTWDLDIWIFVYVRL